MRKLSQDDQECLEEAGQRLSKSHPVLSAQTYNNDDGDKDDDDDGMTGCFEGR